MKKIFIAVGFLIISFTGIAQITYEATYTTSTFDYPVIKYFNHTSPKWMVIDYNNIYLYNLDHSLFRQIPLYDDSAGVQYLSDNLFDTDSSNFEYIFHKGYSFKIVREDNTVLFSRDTASIGGFALISDLNLQQSIFATDSGTKMRIWIANPASNRYEIYSLPGTLACPMDCGGIPYQIINQGTGGLYSKNLNNPYPNPASSQTNIPIELPQGINKGEIVLYDLKGRELKRYTVDRTFSHLLLNTTDLAAGAYYYQLQTTKSNSNGKKLIVIK